MALPIYKLIAILAVVSLVSCGGSSTGGSTPACTSACPQPVVADGFLTVDDVQRVIAQAAHEASTRKRVATIAVVDRVGNVLGIFRMNGAKTNFRISSAKGITGGLEFIDILPDTFAAVTKAITGAYLSSNGNAFSTRTSGQIIQEHFNPGEKNQPGGPLFGVQFSQLACSDLMRRADHGSVGPKRSPLGLSADPGGLPLYKNNQLVGGIGVIADGLYGLDQNIVNGDDDFDESIAVAGAVGFSAPDDIRANRITADGRSLRFVDSDAVQTNPAQAPPFSSLAGSSIALLGYFDGVIKKGVAFGTAESGIRPDAGAFAAQGGFVVVDSSNQNRYPPRDGVDGFLKESDVTVILGEALKVANRARAQIRRPVGSAAQVTIAVVDSLGEPIGLVRTPDGPVFGADVSLQKARTALLFSHPSTATDMAALGPSLYLGASGNPVPAYRSFAQYVDGTRSFLNDPSALGNGRAFSSRAVGNLSRPFFPDGISGTDPGPFSTPYSNWSPFHVGLQLDLSYNAIIAGALRSVGKGDVTPEYRLSDANGCTSLARARNGIQIFAGAFPIFKNGKLVGAIGISGDGIDQDDMVSFLGLDNAGKILKNGIGNAPKEIRADSLIPRGTGTRLRYVSCPQAPFNDSDAQNVCEGL